MKVTNWRVRTGVPQISYRAALSRICARCTFGDDPFSFLTTASNCSCSFLDSRTTYFLFIEPSVIRGRNASVCLQPSGLFEISKPQFSRVTSTHLAKAPRTMSGYSASALSNTVRSRARGESSCFTRRGRPARSHTTPGERQDSSRGRGGVRLTAPRPQYQPTHSAT